MVGPRARLHAGALRVPAAAPGNNIPPPKKKHMAMTASGGIARRAHVLTPPLPQKTNKQPQNKTNQIFLQELLVAAAECARAAQQQPPPVLLRLEGTPLESLGLKALLLLHYALLPSSPSSEQQLQHSPRFPAPALGKALTIGPRAFPSGKPLPAAEAALALGGDGRYATPTHTCICIHTQCITTSPTPQHPNNRRAALLAAVLGRDPPPLPEDAFVPQCDVQALGAYPLLRLLLAVDARATLTLLALAFQVRPTHDPRPTTPRCGHRLHEKTMRLG